MFLCYLVTLVVDVIQMKTSCVALVLCLNINVDPPDVIKITPCARMECWIGKHTSSHHYIFRSFLLIIFEMYH